MSESLAGLDPRPVWDHFCSIAAIPRPSKHEERIVAWVRELAQRHDFDVRSDATGNLVLAVPATPGHESAQTIVLQSHLDMVCEKNRGVEHDFMNDPIRLLLDGEWVKADGTTLGADNGIGVAAMLAVATSPDVVHGPLELLFTIDEETGLTGAQRLDGSLLKGRVLLNLDTEEDGMLCVGCAGGADCLIGLPIDRTAAPAGQQSVRLELRGLRGGHSGLNIHENRGNALKLLTRFLSDLDASGFAFELASFSGGTMHNAIPREADATVTLDASDRAGLQQEVESALARFRSELKGNDTDMKLSLVDAEAVDQVLTRDSRALLLNLLAVLPHGVLAMSPAIAGLVESSSSLAAVETQSDSVRIVTSSRSSIDSSIRGILGSIHSAARLAGANIEVHDGYPGWRPDMDSKILDVMRKIYREIWQREPEVTAVHAGLECGLLGERVDGMEMISFGPLIEGAHSPDERVHVPSVQRFWRALRAGLETLAG